MTRSAGQLLAPAWLAGTGRGSIGGLLAAALITACGSADDSALHAQPEGAGAAAGSGGGTGGAGEGGSAGTAQSTAGRGGAESPATAPDGGDSDASAPGGCEGDGDCASAPDGRARCDVDAGRCVECIAGEDCGDGEHCASGSCRQNVCQPGTTRCEDDGFRACSETGDALSDVVPCEPGTVCEEGVCAGGTGACDPGQCPACIVASCCTAADECGCRTGFPFPVFCN